MSFTFPSSDGLEIHVHRWLPEAEARAVLVVAHGMGEHGGRYHALAEALVPRGWAVYAIDHRGHGRSIKPGEPLGHMADDDAWRRTVDDLNRLLVIAADRHPHKPRLLFGHSMGSFLVQQLLFEQPGAVAGAALSASNGRPPPIAQAGRAIARLERIRLGKRGTSAIIDGLSFRDFNRRFRPNRTAFDWVSRDEREVDAYVADPLCGFIASAQSWIDMLDALPKLTLPENLARIPKSLPIYVFAGDQDPVGDMGKGVRRLVQAYREAWLTDVTVRLYPGGRHEMLHEQNRDEVLTDLVAWLERVVG